MTGDRFEHFDGAYVLGALSSADAAAYEQHLIGCAACQHQVDLLVGLPRLLAAVPAGAFALDEQPPPEGLLLSLQRAVRSHRNRRRWYTAAGGLVAAAVLVLGTALLVRPHQPSSPARKVSMQAVVPSAIHVSAALSSTGWGTRIDLRCTYDTSAATYPAPVYSLTVLDGHGTRFDLGNWRATPGGVTNFSGGTSLAQDDIAMLQVKTATGQVVLQLTP